MHLSVYTENGKLDRDPLHMYSGSHPDGSYAVL